MPTKKTTKTTKASAKVAKKNNSGKSKVTRLARAYKKAQETLDEYQEEYEDILSDFEKLAIERNIALDKLKRGCKEANISAGPFEIVTQNKRVFDGKYLYDSLDEEYRDSVVTIEYTVKPAAFDKLVQAGAIDPKTAKKSIAEIKSIKKALNGPPEIVLG